MNKATRECLTFLVSVLQGVLKQQPQPWTKGDTKGAVQYLTEKLKRSDANKLLRSKCTRRSMFATEELQDLYESKRREELFHRTHVRKCMDTLKPTPSGSRHDATKDEFYFFVTILGFDKEAGLAQYISAELLTDTIEQHYQQEAHHPQYENYGKMVGDDDIMEMAVDRLSRNLQFNGGQYNKTQWASFEPIFTTNHKDKLKKYKNYRDSLAPLVLEAWTKLKENK